MGLKEPIDHNKHRLVNIITGRSIPRKVQNVSDIIASENVFETFDSSEAIEQKFDNTQVLKPKFWFEQTNLQDTVIMLNKLHKSFNIQWRNAKFADINKINYRYKIIHKKKMCSEMGNFIIHQQKGYIMQVYIKYLII